MDYQQYFKKTYPGIIPHEIIALDNAIFASCNLAFDYDGRCIDDKLCAVFCKQIKYAYKLVGPFEERLEADIKELEGNNGYSFFYDIDDMHRKAFYSMQTIIEEYHRYLPYIIEDKNEVEDIEMQHINLESLSSEPQLMKTTDSLQSDASHVNESENPLYPASLRSGRLRIGLLQDIVCRKYLYSWFGEKDSNGKQIRNIDNVSKIKYILFGFGTPLAENEKLVFWEQKNKLILFILYLNRDKGNNKVWDYFRENIVYKDDGPCYGAVPMTNLRVIDYKKELVKLKDEIIRICHHGPNITKEEEEDLK